MSHKKDFIKLENNCHINQIRKYLNGRIFNKIKRPKGPMNPSIIYSKVDKKIQRIVLGPLNKAISNETSPDYDQSSPTSPFQK